MVEYRIKSKFLSTINETIKRLSIMEDGSSATPPVLDKDGNFVSDVSSNRELDIPGVEVEKKSPEKEKEELMSQAVDKLKNAIDIISTFDEIINDIRQIKDEDISDEWVLNPEGNDVFLQSKNAHIFKQNDNILLSHDGNIQIFKTPAELHQWLNKNNFPMVPNVEIRESTDEQVLNLLIEYDSDTLDLEQHINSLGKEAQIPYLTPGFYIFMNVDDTVKRGPFPSEAAAVEWAGDNGVEEYYVEFVGESDE